MKNNTEDETARPSESIFVSRVNEPTQRDKTILFWILSLIIVPVFFYIYSAAITIVAVPLFNLIVKNQSEASVGLLATSIIMLSITFSIGTYIWLWKAYKKHYISI